jgi:hypothetical protein
MSGPLLDVTVLVSTPTGPLSLNEWPYELAGDTFNTVSVTHRKQEAVNPFIEGTYTINSLRENILQALSVYVRGNTHKEFQDATKALCAAFDQSTFEVRRVIEDATEEWQCFSSDYTITLQREFLHAKMAKVDIQVVAHPGARILSNQSSAL